MKVGDKVHIIDGSWSYKLFDGKMDGSQPVGVGEKTIWTVVAFGSELYLPTYSYGFHNNSDKPNNTIVSDNLATFVFTHERFLSVIDSACPTCGRRKND